MGILKLIFKTVVVVITAIAVVVLISVLILNAHMGM
jgi:hypothetical protein